MGVVNLAFIQINLKLIYFNFQVNSNNLIQIIYPTNQIVESINLNQNCDSIMLKENIANVGHKYDRRIGPLNQKILKLNDFDVEFLKTCLPCIVFSLMQVLFLLPYTIIEMTNQFRPNIMLMNVMQYMTYVRYINYGSKFYILYVVSYKFRKEFHLFFKREKK